MRVIAVSKWEMIVLSFGRQQREACFEPLENSIIIDYVLLVRSGRQLQGVPYTMTALANSQR